MIHGDDNENLVLRPVRKGKKRTGKRRRKKAGSYAGGELTKGETINRLKVKKPFNQLVFSSDRALSCLKFAEALDGRDLLPWKE
jgi:hypothetical protein